MGGRRLRTTNSRHSRVGGRHDGYGVRGPEARSGGAAELSEGDSLQICYGSVYAETPQTIEAGVAAVDVHESRTSRGDVVRRAVGSGEREERLRSRKRETYRDHENIRKIGGTIDDISGWVSVYALNGGRWAQNFGVEVGRRSGGRQ